MPSFDTSTLSSFLTGEMVYPNPDDARAAHAPEVDQGAVKEADRFKASMANRNNHVREHLKIYDARPGIGSFDIDTHGFIVAKLETALPQTLEVIFDEKETEIRKIFWPEVEELCKRTCKTSDGRLPKYAFAVGTQKFAPLTKTQRDAIDKPFGALAASYARVAHADFSEVVFDTGYKMLTKRGVPEAEAKGGLDLVYVNAWKPFGQTVKDNPFALLDWTSVDPDEDVHIHPRGKTTTKGSNYGTGVTYNSKHRWVYLPDQQDDEVWLFKQADSRAVNKKPHALAQYGFHTSWKLPDHPANENATRASIALRLVLGYEKIPGSTIASKI